MRDTRSFNNWFIKWSDLTSPVYLELENSYERTMMKNWPKKYMIYFTVLNFKFWRFIFMQYGILLVSPSVRSPWTWSKIPRKVRIFYHISKIIYFPKIEITVRMGITGRKKKRLLIPSDKRNQTENKTANKTVGSQKSWKVCICQRKLQICNSHRNGPIFLILFRFYFCRTKNFNHSDILFKKLWLFTNCPIRTWGELKIFIQNLEF